MACQHITASRLAPPSGNGCEECLKAGSGWVHLRVCLECGHVGCCDSSPGKHASAHFHQTKHAVMASLEPGERWVWCFVDEETLKVPPQYTRYLRR